MSSDEAGPARGPGSELPVELVERIFYLTVDACFASADQEVSALDGCAEYSSADDVYLYAGYRDALRLQLVCRHLAGLVGRAILRDLALPARRFKDWCDQLPCLFKGTYTWDLSLIRSIRFDLDILREGRFLKMTNLRHLTIRTNRIGYRLGQVTPSLPALESIEVPCPGPWLGLSRDLAAVSRGPIAVTLHGIAPRSFMSVVRAEKLTLIHPIDFFGGIQWQYLRKLTLVLGDQGDALADITTYIIDDLDEAIARGDGPRLLDDLKLIFDGQRYNAMDARYRSFGNAMLSRLRQLPAPLGRVHL